jgi:hypothetical protein
VHGSGDYTAIKFLRFPAKFYSQDNYSKTQVYIQHVLWKNSNACVNSNINYVKFYADLSFSHFRGKWEYNELII